MKIKLTTIILFNLFYYQLFAQSIYNNEPVYKDYQKLILTDLKLDLLENKKLDNDCEIYRFSWFRSFGNQVVIDIEKRNNEIQFQYKIGKGIGTKDFKGIKNKKSFSLNEHDWNYFKNLIDNSSFDTLPNREENPNMMDGDTWIIEYKSAIKYKGHSTRTPDSIYATCCLYLLELTGEIFEKEDSRCEYSRFRIYLNMNNEIIIKNLIFDSLIAQVNLILSSYTFKSDWCEIPDYIVTISENGKFKGLRNTKDGNTFLDFLYYFEDFKCRRTYRKILKNIDLSELNLKGTIKIYFDCNYDKEKNQLY